MSDAPTPAAAGKSEVPSSIYLVPYSKIIFLYPTFLVSLIVGIYLNIVGDDPLETSNKAAVIATSIFLGVFAINLTVFAFDFPRTTSLTVFFFIAAVVFGAFLLFQYKPGILPALTGLVSKLHPLANATFFHLFSAILFLLYVGVLIYSRFDYWEVRPNELLHHHGLLSNLERYSAPNLRISKEITDVFEYLLLGSGRLILHPSNEPRAIVLENVLFIGSKERELTRMLGALQVQIRPDSHS